MKKSFIIGLALCCISFTACSNTVEATKNVRSETMETIREDLASIPESNFAADMEEATEEDTTSITVQEDGVYSVGDFASFKAGMEYCEVEDDYYRSLMEEMSNNAVHVAEFAHLHKEDKFIGEVEEIYNDASECAGDTTVLIQLVDVPKVSELEDFNISVPLSDEELEYFINQLKEKYENVSVEDLSEDSGTWHVIIADEIGDEESDIKQITVAAIGYLNDEKTIAAVQLINMNNEETMMSLDERRDFMSQEAKAIVESFVLK